MKQKSDSCRHLSVVNTRPPMYPNAADHTYFARKALDVVTAIVSAMGFTTAMVFLFTLA